MAARLVSSLAVPRWVRGLAAAAAAKAPAAKAAPAKASDKAKTAANKAGPKKTAAARPPHVITTGYKPTSRRTGVLALKVGMLTMFDHWGVALPVTVLQMEGNVVLKAKTEERDGYTAVVVASGPVKAKHVPKPVAGEFAVAQVELRRHLQEFRVSKDALLPAGTKLDARHFSAGQFVDVCGITIGKGFQGAMKRHGFRGQHASHGTSRAHRSLGGTSARQDPGKVWKGKRMHGHMGVDRVTTQNLHVVAVDPVRDLVFIKGAVPGHKGNYVRVTDAIKQPEQFTTLRLQPAFPTFIGSKPSKPGLIHKPHGDTDPLLIE